MSFIVKKAFKDLQDKGHIYQEGDFYPRKGRTKKERVLELSTDANAHGVPLIEEVKEEGELGEDLDAEKTEVKEDE